MRAKRTKKRKLVSGLTLIELMVANAIAILAFVILFYISFTIQDNIGLTSGVLGISQKGRLAINSISKDIREAESVISSYGSHSAGNDTIILKVPSIDASGDIIEPINYFDIIIYTLDSANPEKLLRIVDADTASSRNDATEVITEDIDTLLFSSQGTEFSSIADMQSIKTVTVKIITTTTSPGPNRANEIITSISLRNK